MSGFEKFFSSGKTMLVSFIIALAMYGLCIGLNGAKIAADLSGIFYLSVMIILFFIVLSMYKSFKGHETNALNILSGAAIGILLILSIQTVMSCISYNISVFSLVLQIVRAVLFAILLVNHVKLNSIHKSSAGRIRLNQVILVIIAAYQIFLIVVYSVESCILSLPAEMLLLVIANGLAIIFLSSMIICVETKLNAYKTDRDSAKAEGTWTPSKKAETKEKYFGK